MEVASVLSWNSGEGALTKGSSQKNNLARQSVNDVVGQLPSQLSLSTHPSIWAKNTTNHATEPLPTANMVLAKSKKSVGLGNSLMNDRFSKGKGDNLRKGNFNAGIERTGQNGEKVCHPYYNFALDVRARVGTSRIERHPVEHATKPILTPPSTSPMRRRRRRT